LGFSFCWKIFEWNFEVQVLGKKQEVQMWMNSHMDGPVLLATLLYSHFYWIVKWSMTWTKVEVANYLARRVFTDVYLYVCKSFLMYQQ
jgi:hypothetical protein